MDYQKELNQKVFHYYGDIVRYLFIAAALIMAVGLPFLEKYIELPISFSVVAILILGLLAGMTNPKQMFMAGVNVFVSIIGFAVFETEAVISYQKYTFVSKFFVANFVLGLIFIFAVYFSVKTLRGFILNHE